MTPTASVSSSKTTKSEHSQHPIETTAPAHIDKHDPRSEASTAAHVACPVCQRKMIRIWRRPSDRLLSLFTPLHRYRCDSHDCRWEGNIRQPRSQRGTARRPPSGSQSDAPERSVPQAFVVHMIVVMIGVVTVFAAAYSDWWSTGDSLVSATPSSVFESIGEAEAGMASTQVSEPSFSRATGR